MKKVLLLVFNIGGYEKQIINRLERIGYNVLIINFSLERYRKARKIKNIFLRIYNDQYLRKYKNKNLKDKLQLEELNKDLSLINEEFEMIIKIGSIPFYEETLRILRGKTNKLISHHWDTLEFAKNVDISLEKKYFDKISSFYRKDCEKYGLKYLPNFYFQKFEKITETKVDVYTIMADSNKKELLEKIAKKMKQQEIITNLNLVDYDSKEKSAYINILTERISVEEMLKNFRESKCILEINKDNSKGYTMRTFDAIGLKKKLITTNKSVVNEDFYRPNNILVIDEENIVIPKEFIDSPYEELPKEIYEKYSLENWVKQLMNIEE